MFSYSACNLSITSHIEIPIFNEVGSHKNPDIQILIKDNFEHNSLLKNDKIIFTDNAVFYENESGVIFKITEDSRIIVYLNGNHINNIWESLIGIPFGYALSNKGFSVVHGSSVSINGSAACIFGYSGLGKSTLAISLLNKGFNYITEDLCIFQDKKIYQFNSWVKTTKKLIKDLRVDIQDEIHLSRDSRKRDLFKIKEKNCSKKCNPKIAYFPIEGEKKSIKKITNSEAFEFLFTNFYRFDNNQASDLHRITNILQSLDCYLYERDINAPIEENSEFLSNHIKSLL